MLFFQLFVQTGFLCRSFVGRYVDERYSPGTGPSSTLRTVSNYRDRGLDKRRHLCDFLPPVFHGTPLKQTLRRYVHLAKHATRSSISSSTLESAYLTFRTVLNLTSTLADHHRAVSKQKLTRAEQASLRSIRAMEVNHEEVDTLLGGRRKRIEDNMTFMHQKIDDKSKGWSQVRGVGYIARLSYY